MVKTVFAVALALLLVSIATLTTASDHWADDREAKYVGSTKTDFTDSSRYTKCDDEEIPGTKIQGIGAVKFCGVYTETTVHIRVDDQVFADPVARIYCLLDFQTFLPPPISEILNEVIGEEVFPIIYLLYHTPLGEADPSAVVNIPPDCISLTENAPANTTDILVVPKAETTVKGTATLEYM